MSSLPARLVPDAEQELEGLERLHRSDDPGQHPEHAAFGAVGHEPGWRRLAEEAAVARPPSVAKTET
jgi:hypothetical protein